MDFGSGLARAEKFYNIVLLGQIGVGKTTLINSLNIYNTCGTLDEAQKNDARVLAPCSFKAHGATSGPDEFRCGKDYSAQGKPSTQKCRTHEIRWNDCTLNVIDTPGIGDERGVGRDRLNLNETMDFLSQLRKVHAFCILLKSNDANLDHQTVEYCLTEIISRLHKNSISNIFFVFTNTRGSSFKPGDVAEPLQKILSKVAQKTPDLEVPFQSSNVFCLDNEAFRFLLASKKGARFGETDLKNFEQSWATSFNECHRLIKLISGVEGQGLNPHVIRESIVIDKIKSAIIEIVEYAAPIRQNVQFLKAKMLEVKNCKDDELKRKLIYFPQLSLSQQALRVCTGERCKEIYHIGYVNDYQYHTACHYPCDCDPSLEEGVIGDSRCGVIDGECRICGCGYENHQRILDVWEGGLLKTADGTVKKLKKVKKVFTSAQIAEEFETNLEAEITKYEGECDELEEYASQLASYLKENAILASNDSCEMHLKNLMENHKLLSKNLKQILDNCNRQTDILEDSLRRSSNPIEFEEVEKLLWKISNIQKMGTIFQITCHPNIYAQTFKLHISAWRGTVSTAKNLIANGAEVNSANDDRQTPLHMATLGGHFEMVQLLVEAGADVNCRAEDKETPLHIAAQNDYSQIVKFLLTSKAEVGATLQGGLTALHFAVQFGHVDVIEILLSFKANVNARCDNRRSPLQLAVESGHLEVVEMLVRHGADVFARNYHDSVLHEATKNDDILKLVLGVMESEGGGNARKMRAAINAQDGEGDTPLMWAAERGRTLASQLLLRCDGIDVNMQNFKGSTALHWAGKMGHKECVKLLIDRGADADIKDRNGKTALDLASDKSDGDENYESITKLLSTVTNNTQS